jgi:hypothetical protein
VVVVTERTGAGGGEVATICDSGWVAQPARRPSAPQVIKAVVSRATARVGAEPGKNFMFFNFIYQECI